MTRGFRCRVILIQPQNYLSQYSNTILKVNSIWNEVNISWVKKNSWVGYLTKTAFLIKILHGGKKVAKNPSGVNFNQVIHFRSITKWCLQAAFTSVQAWSHILALQLQTSDFSHYWQTCRWIPYNAVRKHKARTYSSQSVICVRLGDTTVRNL